jgi:hypothetical protein
VIIVSPLVGSEAQAKSVPAPRAGRRKPAGTPHPTPSIVRDPTRARLLAELDRKCQRRDDRAFAAQGGANGEVVAYGGDVVHAHDRGTAIDAVDDCGEGARVALAGPPEGEGADEVLARDRQQHRTAEGDDGVEMAQHLDRLRRGLGEVGPGVEHDAVGCDADLDRHRHAFAQERHDVGDHVVVVGELLALRLGARVHQHHPGPALGARDRQVDVAQPAHVVDEVGALGEHRARDRRFPRIDRDDQTQVDETGDEGRDATDLLVGNERINAGDPRLPTDVDDRRAGGGEHLGALDLGVDAVEQPAVGEGLRAGVHDPHDERLAGRRDEGAIAQPQHRRRA